MGKMGWEGGGDELGGGRRRMKWVVVVGRGLPPFLDLENWVGHFCAILWRIYSGAPQK